MRYICCPWCGYLSSPSEDHHQDVNTWTETCPECNKPIEVIREWVPDYDASIPTEELSKEA